MVRVFAHGAMGCQIDPSWCPIELFLITANAPRLAKAVVYGILSLGYCI